MQTTAAQDCSGGPPFSPRPPLFRCWSCVVTGPLLAMPRWPHSPHTSPPRGATRDLSPTPHRVAYKECPSPPCPPFLSPLILPHEHVPEHSIAPSSLSSASCPRQLIGLPLPCCLHAATPLLPPLGELCRAPDVHPFWTTPHLPRPLLQLQDSSMPSPATGALPLPWNATG
jgi:hypothetical protein